MTDRFVDASAQNIVSLFVPFERKDGSLVLAESGGQPPVGGPNACEAVVTTSGQKCAVAVPVQRCHVFIGRNFGSTEKTMKSNIESQLSSE